MSDSSDVVGSINNINGHRVTRYRANIVLNVHGLKQGWKN